MNVAVYDITSGRPDYTLLKDIVRLGLVGAARENLCGIWDATNGIVMNLDGPFEVASEGPNQVAYKYLVIRGPA